MKYRNDNYCLKAKFHDLFSRNKRLIIGEMFFRFYNPIEDSIINNFSKDDWNNIFINTTEDDLKDLCECSNVVILLWCDKNNNTPRGMLYFEEDFNNPNKVEFHGGTWDHNPKYYRDIFHSIIASFDFILNFKTNIITTCGINNKKADEFQRSLCFEETKRDDFFIYKTLNKRSYEKSYFVNKLRLRI